MTTPQYRLGKPGVAALAAFLQLAALPAGVLVALFYLRAGAGPFWQWNLLDPAYFYLLDGLNIAHGRAPGHVTHPGVTLEILNVVVLLLQQPGAGLEAITSEALADPESRLTASSTAIIALLALCHWGLGIAAWRAFGDILPAFAVQLAPIMSTIVLKRAFVPRPEALVALSTLLLMAVTVMALRPGALQRSGFRYALAFGAAAGFAGATKVTALPVYVLPLVLLGGWRARALYAAAAVAFFVLFVAPAWSAFHQFVDWIGSVTLAAGAHGQGAATVIDVEHYPKALAKVLKRPSLRVPMGLAVITLALVWWRRRHGAAMQGEEVRGLAAVTTAQLVHALVVAKHPVAFYMIPSYMLSALSVLLSVRLFWSLRPAAASWQRWGRYAGVLAVAGYVVAQAAAVVRLDDELSRLNRQAMALDNNRFELCSRIYIYAASSPVFALFLADEVTGNRYAPRLAGLYPGEDYWIEDWYDQGDVTFRNWAGPRDFTAVRNSSQCLFFRGNRPGGIDRFLRRFAADLAPSKACSTGAETVATVGVDCHGRLLR